MRIAIITGGAGGGHNAAARNLAESALPGTEVKIFKLEDCLPKTNRRLLITSYDFFSTFGKGFLWRFIYWTGNTKLGMLAYKLALTEFSEDARRSVSQAIAEFKPDKIISTIFLSSPFLNKELDHIPKYMVVTDFGLHHVWYHPNVFEYFVANQEVANTLKKINPHVRVTITGIPVPMALYTKTEDITNQASNNQKPKVLLLAGGTGLMRADHYVAALLPHADTWSITVVCGKNDDLVKKVLVAAGPMTNKITIIGWTDALSEYIKNSDIIITKPGGLTTSECLAAGKFMILVSPIPGQEEANAEFLINKNRAVLVQKPADLPGTVISILLTLDKKNRTIYPVRPAVQSIWEALT